MKLSLSRDSLHAALGVVARVATRGTIPILSNVLLEAADGMLKLRATDLDIEITASAPAEVVARGATTVDALTLRDFIAKTSAKADIALEQVEGQLVVRCGRARLRLSVLPAEDFPNLEAVKSSHAFSLPAKPLAAMLAQAAIAISTEETRYYLNGIYLHVSGERLRMVATTGHILARVDGPQPAGAQGMPGVILPRKAVAELARLAAKTEGDVAIAVGSTKVSATFPGGIALTTKLIDGTFPDYARVIPANNSAICVVDREALATAIGRAGALSGKDAGRKLKMSFADGVMTLEVTNPDAGSSHDEINVEWDSPPIEIGFNASYLLEIVGVMTGGRVEIALADPGSPALLRCAEDPAALFVIMPLRISP